MAKRRRKENLVKLEDFASFLDEFHGESDRAAAILGAAYLDECLRQLITSFLIDDSTKVDELLEGPLAPLGSFASRISASYCMGLISEDEHHDLQVIRTIRNMFAHDLHGVSFSTAQVVDQCNSLQFPQRDHEWPGEPKARNLFSLTIDFLALILLEHRIPQHMEQRRVVPSGFEVRRGASKRAR